MRTHLLRATYAFNSNTDKETDVGNAANDECYEKASVTTALTTLRPTVTPQKTEPSSPVVQDSNDNDDYWLGGYAGI